MAVSGSEAKAWAREVVRGLWTSPMIPFTEDGSVDHQGIRHNVEYILSLGVNGVGFGFSEPWYLSVAERMDAFATFIDAVGGRVPCYVHAVDYSVPETVRLMEHCRRSGADAVMLWVPMEFAKSEEMACEWYEYVAGQVDVPVFAYNTYHSGINLDIPAIERVAAIANVCALKDAVNDYVHGIAASAAVGERVVVSNPLEEFHLPMAVYAGQQVLLGATSVYLMQSPTHQPIRAYMERAAAGDVAGAWRGYYELAPLRELWKGIYSELWNRRAAQHPVAMIKHWMDVKGMCGGGVRPPMPKVTPGAMASFDAALEQSGWLDRLGETLR